MIPKKYEPISFVLWLIIVAILLYAAYCFPFLFKLQYVAALLAISFGAYALTRRKSGEHRPRSNSLRGLLLVVLGCALWLAGIVWGYFALRMIQQASYVASVPAMALVGVGSLSLAAGIYLNLRNH